LTNVTAEGLLVCVSYRVSFISEWRT